MASNESLADALTQFLKSKGIEVSDDVNRMSTALINLIQNGNTVAATTPATIAVSSNATIKDEKTVPATPTASNINAAVKVDKSESPTSARVLRSSAKEATPVKPDPAKSPVPKRNAMNSGGKKRARAPTLCNEDEADEEIMKKETTRYDDNSNCGGSDAEFKDEGKRDDNSDKEAKGEEKKTMPKRDSTKTPSADKTPAKKRKSDPTLARKPQGGLDPAPKRTGYDPKAAYAQAVAENRPPPHVGARNSHAAARRTYDQTAQVYRCQRGTVADHCNATFTRVYDLTRHEETVHDRKEYYICPLCDDDDKKYGRLDALIRHFRAVHPSVNIDGDQKEKAKEKAKEKGKEKGKKRMVKEETEVESGR